MTALTIPIRYRATTRTERLLVRTARLLLTTVENRVRARETRVIDAQDAMAETRRDRAATTWLLPR